MQGSYTSMVLGTQLLQVKKAKIYRFIKPNNKTQNTMYLFLFNKKMLMLFITQENLQGNTHISDCFTGDGYVLSRKQTGKQVKKNAITNC